MRAFSVDTFEPRTQNTIPLGARPVQLVVMEGNAKVYSLNQEQGEDGSVTAVEVENLEAAPITTIVGKNPTEMIGLDSSFVMTASRTENFLTLVEADNQTVRIVEGVGAAPSGITYLEEDGRIYVASNRASETSSQGAVYIVDRTVFTVEEGNIPLPNGIGAESEARMFIQFRDTGYGKRLFVLNQETRELYAINIEEDENTLMGTTGVPEEPLWMLVEELDTYPPSPD